MDSVLARTVSKVGIAIQDRNSTWVVRVIKETISSWHVLGYPSRLAAVDNFWRAVFLDRPVAKIIEKPRNGVNAT